MILPKKTKINYQNRTLKKKKFKNKFYKVTKRNNLRLSKKKGGASPGKVYYSIGTNFYDCGGTGNEVKINKLSEKPTSETKIIELPYPSLEDYNEGDFIQYGDIFLFCKELKKNNVIFEIYNNIPDGKDAKFKVEKKPGDEDEDEPEPGNGPNKGAEGAEGDRKDGEDGPGEDGPEPGPITTYYYYDKLKLNDTKEGEGLDKKTIPLLNENMEKVLLELDNYKEGDLEKDRIIKIETQELGTNNIVEKQMLPEEYLKNLVLNHGYEIGNRTTAIEEIISCFYEGGTKKEDVDKGIEQLKNRAQMKLDKSPK